MQVYIANATMQNRVANFRLPEVTKNIQLQIPRGRQVRVPKDLGTPDIESLLEQLGRYGAIKADEINSRRSHAAMIPYLISIDKPVKATDIDRVMKHNKGALIIRGAETRKMAAIASAQVMSEAAPETLANFETVLIEEKSGGMPHADGEKPIAEALRVAGDAAGQEDNRSSRRKRS